jgi:hypothetical protein
MYNYFIYKGKQYGEGTIVAINKYYEHIFGFKTHLVFLRQKGDRFYFKSLYNSDGYYLTQDNINEYVDQIAVPKSVVVPHSDKYKIEAKYVDGIVEAWTWYLLIMFGGLFVKGGTIFIWLAASYIFWSWRSKQMKGE